MPRKSKPFDFASLSPPVRRKRKEAKKPEPVPMPVIFENPKQLLTVKQVAERLGVTLWAVYNWVDKGTLPAIRLGDGPTRSHIRITGAAANSLLRPAAPNAGQVPHF